MPDAGVVMMAFGDRAAREASALVINLAETHPHLGRLVVGDVAVAGADHVPWDGPDPFDRSQPHNYRFRAGRVKPSLAAIAPWARTMYADTDAKVIGSLDPAFALLERFDMCVTYHPDPLRRIETQDVDALYNKPRAGWYHNRREREYTTRLFGDGVAPYWNSGVVIWRRCRAVESVFRAWSEEWERFAQWDEQLALMRAVRANPLRLCVLPVCWNAPHRSQAKVIHHWYGRGTSRTDGE